MRCESRFDSRLAPAVVVIWESSGAHIGLTAGVMRCIVANKIPVFSPAIAYVQIVTFTSPCSPLVPVAINGRPLALCAKALKGWRGKEVSGMSL